MQFHVYHLSKVDSSEQVSSLTDDEMQAVADILREEVTKSAGAFVAGDFLPTVRFIVSLYFGENSPLSIMKIVSPISRNS